VLDDNVAKLSDQIEIYENALRDERTRAGGAEAAAAKSIDEIAALKRELANASTDANAKSETNEGQIAQLESTISSLKQSSARETQRLVLWSGSAAVIAACLAGLLGWWLAPTNAVQSAANIQDVNSQIATEKQKLADLQNGLDNQKAELSQQQSALTQQRQDFAKEQQDFAKVKADFEAKQKAMAQLQSAVAALPLPAQCDALAGYQYDPDRPANSGWMDSKDVPPAAQTTCESALQTVVNDAKTRRRMMLEIGRIYQAIQPEKALGFWKQAKDLGSSQVGRYYADRNNNQSFNAKTSWENIKTAADMGNPTGLYYVAYNYLIRDHDNIFTPAPADLAVGEEYLRKALTADIGGATYYIAGVHYWDTNRELATSYLNISKCVKHYNDDHDAERFYFTKTGHHLCQ
jgi:hypothetical protein